MKKLVVRLNKNPYFRFLASVRLAVPLMLILLCIVAGATIIESRYNGEYARLLVYDSTWFTSLMILLWINILLSTVSRYPYKIRHLGFVVVHAGLLALLAGGAMTKTQGIDGQLRVIEGARNGTVSLDRLSLELIDVQANSAIRVPFQRSVSQMRGDALDFLNDRFNSKIMVREYWPFADIRQAYVEDGSATEGAGSETPIALGFLLKSPFFDVSEWLHSREQAEMRMGPAQVRLVIDRPGTKSAGLKTKANSVRKKKSVPSPNPSTGAGKLVIRDEKTKSTLAEIPLHKLKAGLSLPKGFTVLSAKTYAHAVVSDNRLAEGDKPGTNPALEIQFRGKSSEEAFREVSYAKFPGFSLLSSKGKSVGLVFEYQIAGLAESQDDDTQTANETSEPSASRSGNVIEFHVNPRATTNARVELYKNDEKVGESVLQTGESMTTPWMGIKITLGSLKVGAVAKTEVTPAVVQPRMPLPPGALYLTTAGASADQGFWLAEGEARRVTILGREYEVYFGRESLELPFSLELLEFKKTDYPGTETPMSYESRVRVNGLDPETTISMNEPLKYAGYTLYQSSYDIQPGRPRASIFSVNRDPGRWVKYLGSLILSLGIVIFTLMRSRFYKNLKISSQKNSPASEQV
jgi:hypothetical protein